MMVRLVLFKFSQLAPMKWILSKRDMGLTEEPTVQDAVCGHGA